MNGYNDEELYTTDQSRSTSLGVRNSSAVMYQSDFVNMLFTAQSLPNYYDNGRNLGQYDGQKYSFDCWNLIKTVLSGWHPYPDYQAGGTKVTGDVTGEQLLKACVPPVTYGQSQDFSQVRIPGTYLYMSGHSGTYVGDFHDEQGRHYNVIECTSWAKKYAGPRTPVNMNPDGTPKGVICTYISPTGKRLAYEGSSASGGQWANYGLLKYIQYEDSYDLDVDVVIGTNPTTGQPIYDVTGPVSNSDYIIRKGVLYPRTEAPRLTPNGDPIYEDDTKERYWYETVTNNDGTTSTIAHEKRVKYDGRDMWFAPDGWATFSELNNCTYAWARFSEAMDPDPNNLLISHMPCQLLRGGSSVDMYKYVEDGYTRNVACAVGAVMCFYNKKKKNVGHVCVVEQMSENGVIVTSEYTEQGRFQIVKRQKRYGYWDYDDWVFQGFIHNPASTISATSESALDTFCNVALESIGQTSSWIMQTTQIMASNISSAGMIIAIAKTAGSVLNVIIPNTISVTGIGRVGVLQEMGEWIDGPANGKPGQPQVGDIVIIRDRQYKKPSKYQGDTAGIITSMSGSSFEAVIYNGHAIVKKSYTSGFSRIAGYYRPDWERVDGTADSVKLYRNLHGLYTSGTVIEDACARDVCYVKDNLPSIKRTDIRLSAINYTGMLSNMYTVFATSSTSDAADTDLIVDLWTTTIKSWFQENGVQFTADSATVIDESEINNAELAFTGASGSLSADVGGFIMGVVDGMSAAQYSLASGIAMTGASIVTPKARQVFNYLMTTGGMHQAAACAVLANIRSESAGDFVCSAEGDYMWQCTKCNTWNSTGATVCKKCKAARNNTPAQPTSFGLCQWHFGRGDRMKAAAGPDWKNNLTGQLDYLMSELLGGYRGVYTSILAEPNTIQGCMNAVYTFVAKFEIPANIEGATLSRRKHALRFWQDLVE